MAEASLFGVAVPEAAVRLRIRPVLGRGRWMPLYEGRLEDGIPSETDVALSASKNENFWAYVDAQLKKKRITVAEIDGEWKLRLEFVNQLGAEEAVVTQGGFEFYRATTGGGSEADAPEARSFERAYMLLDRLATSTEKAHKRIAKSSAKALAKITEATTAAIAEAAKAGGSALAEATKQTAVVTEITKALQQETLELKQGIFELQTERAKTPAAAPQTMLQQVKEMVDVGQTVMGFAQGLGGTSSAAPAPTPAPAPAPTPKPASTGDA